MKSKQLYVRLNCLTKSESILEVIKDCELTKIKGGGGCPNLMSCNTFVTCYEVYKSGTKGTVVISPTLDV